MPVDAISLDANSFHVIEKLDDCLWLGARGSAGWALNRGVQSPPSEPRGIRPVMCCKPWGMTDRAAAMRIAAHFAQSSISEARAACLVDAAQPARRFHEGNSFLFQRDQG